MKVRLLPLIIFLYILVVVIKFSDVLLNLNKESSDNVNMTIVSELSSKVAMAATETKNIDNKTTKNPPPVADGKKNDGSLEEMVIGPDGKLIAKRWLKLQKLVNSQNANISLDKPKNFLDSNLCTDVNIDLLKTLSKRKEELEKWKDDAITKQSALQISEKEIDIKLSELKRLKTEVSELLNQLNGKESSRFNNLVKIYESMKPQDAAKIFNNLDISLIVKVISRMKESKVAVILANVKPEKAKEITTAFAMTKTDIPKQ